MKNTLIKVLSFLMALTMIVGVFSAITISSAAECKHTKGEQVGDPVPATCASIGYTFYKCADCGAIYPDDIVLMSKEHTGIVEVPASDATCLYPAMTEGTYCSHCGVDKDGLVLEWIDEPEFVEGSEALGHTFIGSDNGAVSCELATVYTCTTCHLTAEEAQAQADKLGFSYDYSEYFTSNNVLGPGHEWAYVVKEDPTTCEDGVMAGECQVCGSTKEVVITATHKFDTDFLSCEEYVGKKCSLCGVAHPDAVVNEDQEHDLDATPTLALNSTLEKMGYTSATLYKAPTCTDEGYSVHQCLGCGEYVQQTIDAIGHDFSGELKFEPNKNTYPCNGDVGGTYYYECQNGCKEILVLDTKADRGHLLKTTVVEPTCTAEGYTLVECLVCDYETKSSYTAKAPHELGEYVYSYDITAGVDHSKDYTRHKECANCTYVTATELLISKTSDGNHALATNKTLTTPNCVEPAYEVYKCTVPGCTYVEVYDADPNTDGVQKNYVGTTSTSEHGGPFIAIEGKYQKPTCVKEGYQVYRCTTCEVEVTFAIPMVAHNYGNTYDANGNGKFTDAGDKNWVAVAATCLKTGKTAGICCTICGETKVSPQITPVDPSNHKNASGVTVEGQVMKTVAANCQNFGYVEKYYSCCNKYVKIYNETGSLDLNNHINKTTHKYVAPVCEKTGSHAYEICNDCGVITILDSCTCGLADHSTVATPVIRAAEHNYEIVWGKYETCDEIGYNTHLQCTACKKTIGKKVIPAHGKQYQAAISFVAPTCTTIGYRSSNGEKICTKCEIEYKGALSPWIIPANGHYVVDDKGTDDPRDDEVTTVSALVEYKVEDTDCTTASGVVWTCSECQYTFSNASEFEAAPNKEHVYNTVWHAYTAKDNKVLLDGVETGYMVCEVPTYEYRECTADGCTEQEVRNYVPAINHYSTEDGAKKELLLDCQNIADSIGYTCDLCYLTVTTDLEPTHNGTKATKLPTCTEDGYYLLVCTDCNMHLNIEGKEPTESSPAISQVYPMFGHNPYKIGGAYGYQGVLANSNRPVNTSVDYVVESKEPTASEDGFITYRCRTCEEIVTVVIPAIKGLGFTVTTDDAVVNNTTITVKIAVDAKEFEFNSFFLNVGYDCLSLEFVGAELVFDGFAAADAVTLVAKANVYSSPYGPDYGEVAMNVYVPNNVTGLPKNVSVTADEAAFIELTFNVRSTASENFYDEAVIYYAVSGDYMIVDEDGEVVYLNDDEYDEIEAEIDEEALTLNFAGDANGDYMIDNGDSITIMTLIYENGYDIAADLNKDGVVDLLDLGALLQFTVSKGGMLDYLEMIGVTVDDIVADMTLRYDINADGMINETDKALLASLVVELIEEEDIPYYAMSYVLAEAEVESIEDLVEKVARELAMIDSPIIRP